MEVFWLEPIRRKRSNQNAWFVQAAQTQAAHTNARNLAAHRNAQTQALHTYAQTQAAHRNAQTQAAHRIDRWMKE